MNGILDALAEIMRNNLWAAPLLSLLAGIVTSFTPCSLATVPMLLACVGASEADRKKAVFVFLLLWHSGMAVTFGIFGSVASVIGHYMHEAGHWWTILMGILMLLMSLQVLGVINIIPHIHITEDISEKGYMGAFLTGASRRAFCFSLCNSCYGCSFSSCRRAGKKCLVGNPSDGSLCTWAQHSSDCGR